MTLKTMGTPPTHGLIACAMGPDGTIYPLQMDANGAIQVSGNNAATPEFVSVVAMPDRVEISGSATSAIPLPGCTITDTSGNRSIAVQVTALAAASTLVAEECNDNSAWTTLTSVGGVSAMTALGLYGFNYSGKQVRVRQSVYGGSGTSSVVAEMRAAAIPTPPDVSVTITDFSVIANATGASQQLLAASDKVRSVLIINQGTTDWTIDPTGGVVVANVPPGIRLRPGDSYSPKKPPKNKITGIGTLNSSLLVQEGN